MTPPGTVIIGDVVLAYSDVSGQIFVYDVYIKVYTVVNLDLAVFVGFVGLTGLDREGDDAVLTCFDIGDDVAHGLVLTIDGACEFGDESAAALQSLEVSCACLFGGEHQRSFVICNDCNFGIIGQVFE